MFKWDFFYKMHYLIFLNIVFNKKRWILFSTKKLHTYNYRCLPLRLTVGWWFQSYSSSLQLSRGQRYQLASVNVTPTMVSVFQTGESFQQRAQSPALSTNVLPPPVFRCTFELPVLKHIGPIFNPCSPVIYAPEQDMRQKNMDVVFALSWAASGSRRRSAVSAPTALPPPVIRLISLCLTNGWDFALPPPVLNARLRQQALPCGGGGGGGVVNSSVAAAAAAATVGAHWPPQCQMQPYSKLASITN